MHHHHTTQGITHLSHHTGHHHRHTTQGITHLMLKIPHRAPHTHTGHHHTKKGITQGTVTPHRAPLLLQNIKLHPGKVMVPNTNCWKLFFCIFHQKMENVKTEICVRLCLRSFSSIINYSVLIEHLIENNVCHIILI